MGWISKLFKTDKAEKTEAIEKTKTVEVIEQKSRPLNKEVGEYTQ